MKLHPETHLLLKDDPSISAAYAEVLRGIQKIWWDQVEDLAFKTYAAVAGRRPWCPTTYRTTCLMAAQRLREHWMAAGMPPQSGPLRIMDAISDTLWDPLRGGMIQASGLWLHWKFRQTPVIWHVDRALAELLFFTDPPASELDAAYLHLPFPALYVAVPPLFKLVDPSGAEFPVEGVYLGESASPPAGTTRRAISNLPDLVSALDRESRPSIVVEAQSKCRPGTPGDDAISSFHLVAGQAKTPWSGTEKGNESFGLLWDFIVNFLIAYKAGYLEVVEEKRPWPKSPKKQKRLERLGAAPTRIVVRLGKRSKMHARRGAGSTGLQPRAHWVRGHWRGYWVLDVTDEHPIRSRVIADGKQSFLVLRWIEPFIRSGDTAPAPEYRLVDGRRP